MNLRITAYGDPLLRKKAEIIKPDYPELNILIDNMFETMYDSNGVGLAAPQVGLGISMFIIDTSHVEDYKEGVKKVFINPEVIEKSGELWEYEEGCLSLPKIRENVWRHETVRIHYFDENFVEKTDTFSSVNGRVILHEYDHLQGVLFIDHITSFRRRLVKKKLDAILNGSVDAGYPMKFYKTKKR